jgi:cytochrome c556
MPLVSLRSPAVTLFLTAAILLAQVPTMKQLMLDLIHPASNDIFITVSRGGPANEKDWASVRHSALTLQQSAQTLLTTGPQTETWSHAAKLLSDAASDAYRAAQAKDAKALAAIPARLDASCTNCHKLYRPNVFPPAKDRVE